MVEPKLTTEDIQAILTAKANIELQNIALRRQITELQTSLADCVRAQPVTAGKNGTEE